MELYKHNQEAYEKVMEAFKTKQRAAIVHATGTGKSYIIAAVSEQFERVCVIAPNNFVLEETKNVCKEGTVFKTYTSFLYTENEKDAYDLIVLDEFHRTGASKWGYSIQQFLLSNPNAKLLGTSATHIRYLDEQRNMADEMFDGNIVSHISLVDAVSQGILKEPIYVSALYSVDESVRKYQQKIMEKRGVTDEWKEENLKKLYGISSNWSNALGVSHIIAKYLPKDTKRIIIFFSRVEDSANMKNSIGRWFAMAGFSKLRFYSLDYRERFLEKEMESFRADEDCLKIALSVNMLNEGVHIPNVDSVIMLRNTCSRNITEQQIGRCMTADKDKTPVIFDLVNNIDNINETPNFTFIDECSSRKGGRKMKSSSHRRQYPFKVIDETRDLRVFFSQFDEHVEHEWDYYKSLIEEFVKNNNTLPNFVSNPKLADRMRYYFSRNENAREWLMSIGFKPVRLNSNKQIPELIKVLSDYCEKNGKLPTIEKGEAKCALLTLHKRRKEGLLSEEELSEMYSIIKKYSKTATFDDRLDDLRKKMADGVPFNKKDINFLTANSKRFDHETKRAFCDYCNMRSIYSIIDEIEGFINKEGRLPVAHKKENREDNVYLHMMKFVKGKGQFDQARREFRPDLLKRINDMIDNKKSKKK